MSATGGGGDLGTAGGAAAAGAGARRRWETPRPTTTSSAPSRSQPMRASHGRTRAPIVARTQPGLLCLFSSSCLVIACASPSVRVPSRTAGTGGQERRGPGRCRQSRPVATRSPRVLVPRTARHGVRKPSSVADMEQHLEPDTRTLERSLRGYVQAVAAATGVPEESTTVEISDTATAYLGLPRRWPDRPDLDVMLVLSYRRGCSSSFDTFPADEPVLIARQGVVSLHV